MTIRRIMCRIVKERNIPTSGGNTDWKEGITNLDLVGPASAVNVLGTDHFPRDRRANDASDIS